MKNEFHSLFLQLKCVIGDLFFSLEFMYKKLASRFRQKGSRPFLLSYPLPYSAAHLMTTLFGRIGVSLQWPVMLTGFGGRFGSTPGLLVGIGLGS